MSKLALVPAGWRLILPPPPPVGGILYGPDGTEWPTNTPTMADPITATVSTMADLQNFLAANVNTPGKVVVALADGTWAGGTSNPINEVAGMAARSSRILIRPQTMGGVTWTSQVQNYCSSTCLAGFIGSAYMHAGSNMAFARLIVGMNGNLSVAGVNGFEIVGCVKKNRGLLDSGDSMDIKSATDPATSTNPPAANGTFSRNWIEGIARTSTGTGHNDTIQWLATTASMNFDHMFIGQGGNSTTWLYKLDFEGSAFTPADVTLDNCYVCPCDASDDFLQYMFQGVGTTITNSVFEGSLKLRYPSSSGINVWTPSWAPVTFSNVIGSSLQWIGASGSGHIDNTLLPGFTQSSSIVRPTFTPPPWWNSDWDNL